jgi:hypothetical protein
LFLEADGANRRACGFSGAVIATDQGDSFFCFPGGSP